MPFFPDSIVDTSAEAPCLFFHVLLAGLYHIWLTTTVALFTTTNKNARIKRALLLSLESYLAEAATCAATSAAKSTSFFSMPSPTSKRMKLTTVAPAFFNKSATFTSGLKPRNYWNTPKSLNYWQTCKRFTANATRSRWIIFCRN